MTGESVSQVGDFGDEMADFFFLCRHRVRFYYDKLNDLFVLASKD